MARTSKPTVAGILCIVSGFLGVILSLVIWQVAVIAIADTPEPNAIDWSLFIVLCLWPPISGILAMVGGYFALMRRRRRWAVAGSIAAMLTPGLVLGIVAVILVAESESEFNGEPTDYEAEIPTDDKVYKVYDVCPSCGSSNINKAVKRMPKSQREIKALGFKTEWDCLCFNCRFTWVERDKQ